MNTKTLKALEYDKILQLVSATASAQPVKRRISELLPCFDYSTVQRLQGLTQEAYCIKYKYCQNPDAEFEDVFFILQKAKAGATLNNGELIKIYKLIRCARIYKNSILSVPETELLREMAESITIDTGVERAIDDAVLNEDMLKDTASDKLFSIRRAIGQLNQKLKEKLDSYTRNSAISKYLQDNLVTIRSNRYVIPVKAEYRSSVQGLVHDISSSGATVFIEPFAVVELNNELREKQILEQAEIQRILTVLTQKVADAAQSIEQNQEFCIDCGVTFAKADYGVSINAAPISLTADGCLELIDARHPLIDPKAVVPVTIKAGGDRPILLISGPNTGGKTVALKTAGLFVLMACTGLWLPLKESSRVSVFDQVFCDIGDAQSISESLSTFSAHIVNIAEITVELGKKSLVLLDEIGSGTDPTEGAALAIGITKYIENSGCTAVITTHYSELKKYAMTSDKILNGCMHFDQKTLRPTFKLILGMPGMSNGIKIAKNFGLNQEILRYALDILENGSLRFEQVLESAQNIKAQADSEFEQLNSQNNRIRQLREELENSAIELKKRIEHIDKNAKTQIRRKAAAYEEQAQELIEQMKEQIKLKNEQALNEMRQLNKKLDGLETDNTEEDIPCHLEPMTDITEGAETIIKSLNARGIILTPPDKNNKVTVAIGQMKTQVSINDLLKPPDITQEKKPHKATALSQASEEVGQFEIMLLGLTVSEAELKLEPIIQTALPNSVLRIVHGKGTGALGRGVQAYLKTCPRIKSYRYGRYGEGESGVTIAEIKG